MVKSIQRRARPSMLLFGVLVIAAYAFGCGDDDGGNGTPAAGEASFEISGEIEATKQGQASFVRTDSTLNISFHDNETFSLSLLRTGDDTSIPSEGAYTIGSVGAADFHVVYTAYVDGDVTISQEYTNWDGESGHLVIVDADEDSATGVFDFQAWRYDENFERLDEAQISVSSGEFTAHLSK